MRISTPAPLHSPGWPHSIGFPPHRSVGSGDIPVAATAAGPGGPPVFIFGITSGRYGASGTPVNQNLRLGGHQGGIGTPVNQNLCLGGHQGGIVKTVIQVGPELVVYPGSGKFSRRIGLSGQIDLVSCCIAQRIAGKAPFDLPSCQVPLTSRSMAKLTPETPLQASPHNTTASTDVSSIK